MEIGDVVKQGSITATASVGTKKDAVANKENSQANPQVHKDYSQLPPRRFQDTNYSKVGFTVGMTKSLGNFEFLRIDVSVEDFCLPEKKVEQWNESAKLAGEYVVEAVSDLAKYLDDKKSSVTKPKDKLGF